MKVWIFQTHDPENGTIDLYVYDDQILALKDACYCAASYMQECSIDDPNHEANDHYVKVTSAINSGLYQDALAEYADWQYQHCCFEEVLSYTVFSEDVKSGCQTNASKWGNSVSVPYQPSPAVNAPASSSASAIVQPQNEPQKPCKVCGKNVTQSEPSCWWCGALNPGK